jgi:tetrahydromethanopterin S-methyltransferase subunit G
VFNNRRIDGLKDLFKAEIGRLEGVMNARFAIVDTRLDRIEQRLDRVEARLDRVDSRLDGIERRVGHIHEQRLIR